MGKYGPKSKPTKGSSELSKSNETIEHDAKKRKHNHSQTDDSLEKNFQLEQMDGHVFQLESDLTQTKKQVDKLTAIVTEQEEQLNQEKRFRAIMFARINDLEQYSRKNNLRVFGIPDKDRKESSSVSEQLVLKLFKEKLGINWINPSDIEIAHRTGRFSENSSRAIIVKLVSRKTKTEIIMKRTKLKGKGISISEDLTVENVRRLKKLNDLDVCTQSWSHGGKLFCKNANDVKIEVLSTDIISEDIFQSAAQRRNEAQQQRNEAQRSESSRNQIANSEQNRHDKEKSPLKQKEKEAAIKKKAENENNKFEGSRPKSQKSKDSAKKSENKNSESNKKGSEKNHNTPNVTPDSKKNNDSSSASMELGDLMSDGAAIITPQHSSTPTNDDNIKKIAAHKEAIDIRLKLLAGQQIDC